MARWTSAAVDDAEDDVIADEVVVEVDEEVVSGIGGITISVFPQGRFGAEVKTEKHQLYFW